MPTAKWHIKIHDIFKMHVWYMIRVVTVYQSAYTIKRVKKSMYAFINKERCINDWKETSSSHLAVQKRESKQQVYSGILRLWLWVNIGKHRRKSETLWNPEKDNSMVGEIYPGFTAKGSQLSPLQGWKWIYHQRYWQC